MGYDIVDKNITCENALAVSPSLNFLCPVLNWELLKKIM